MMPYDQAEGLRQLFAATRTRFVPVLSNPHVAFGGVMLERLTMAFSSFGLSCLVVDAAERAPEPHELASIDLAEGIETLSADVSYLAARGLPLRHVDAQGSTAGFLQAVADAAPQVGVVLVHASAADLARMFSQRAVRPLLLADERPASVTHAYAGMKLLAVRAGLMVHDLVIAAPTSSKRAAAIATQVARCADDFLGAVLHGSVVVDPATSPSAPAAPALRQLVRELLMACEPGTAAPVDAHWRAPVWPAAARAAAHTASHAARSVH